MADIDVKHVFTGQDLSATVDMESGVIMFTHIGLSAARGDSFQIDFDEWHELLAITQAIGLAPESL